MWSAIGHLWGVCNTEAWRAAYNACLPKVTAYGLELAQSEPLYRAYLRQVSEPADVSDPSIVEEALAGG